MKIIKEILGVLVLTLMLNTSYGQDDKAIGLYNDAKRIINDYNKVLSPKGVDESFVVEFGDVQQFVSVKGANRENPLLLFLHGGPASPLSPVSWLYQKPLEEYFTVVNYDQRFAGKTYGLNDTANFKNKLEIAQYVDDATALAEMLIKKYGKKKIVLVGHSWGTIIGLKAVLKKPSLYTAYIGIGQIINMMENERLSFEYARKTASDHNNEVAVKELDGISPYPGNEIITRERIIIARKWAQYYGGLLANTNNFFYFFNAPILSPYYDDQDVKNIGAGSLYTLDRLMPDLLAVNLTNVERFPVPIIMLYGRHDYTTPTLPVLKWMKQLNAPVKREIWFENSAHMIPFEEPGKFLITLVDEIKNIKE